MNALFVSHYPLPRTITLASLVKGEVLAPEKIRATTGGIAFLPYPFRFSDTSVNNPSIVGSASHCNRSSLYTRELKVIVQGEGMVRFLEGLVRGEGWCGNSSGSRPNFFGRQHLTFDKGGKCGGAKQGIVRVWKGW